MRGRACHPGWVTASMVATLSGAAWAQPRGVDEGPVVVGERTERFRTFELDRLNASLDFYTRYQRDHQDSEGLGERTDTELLFRESIGISSRFFIGHENLVDVAADGNLGLEQNFVDSETEGIENEQETGLFTLFNVNALVLGEGPAPVTLFARRDETLLERAFAGTVESRSTEFGLSVRTFLDTVPTTLSLTRRVLEQEDQLGFNDDTLIENTALLQSLWDSGTGHRITLDYELDLVDEDRERGGDTSFTRHDATLIHSWEFGAQDQHDLRSQLRLFDQSGDFEQRRVRLFETLILRHSDTFETRYDATLESQETAGQEQQFASGLFTLRHELYESLVTTVNAGVNHTSLPDDDFTSNEVLGGVDFEYTKRVPLGRLDASLGLNYSLQEDSERGDVINFVDVPRVFPDASPILLTGANVLPGSVMVTNLAGTRRFTRGLDFTLREFEDRVELRRVVGGPISEGETVLVDFALGPEPAATIHTLSAALAGRYTFLEGPVAGLAPYAELRDVSQDISPSAAERIPIETRIFRVGTDYRIGFFTINAEYENQESSIAPLDAWRASLRYERLLGLNSFVRADLTHETIDFGDGGSTIDLDRALGEWGYAFANGLDVRVELLFRHERDSLAGDTLGFEQALELNWRIRQTTLSAAIRNAFLEGEDVSTDSQTLTFALRRLF